jgi:hypothetical protein
MMTSPVPEHLRRQPHVVIQRLRGTTSRRIAARVRLLCIASMAMLPGPWRPTGRSWNPMASHCDLVELEHPSQPSDYVYRPIDGYVHWYDVVFSAASFARLFDLDPIAVESWLWTGRVMTVEEVLHA